MNLGHSNPDENTDVSMIETKTFSRVPQVSKTLYICLYIFDNHKAHKRKAPYGPNDKSLWPITEMCIEHRKMTYDRIRTVSAWIRLTEMHDSRLTFMNFDVILL